MGFGVLNSFFSGWMWVTLPNNVNVSIQILWALRSLSWEKGNYNNWIFYVLFFLKQLWLQFLILRIRKRDTASNKTPTISLLSVRAGLVQCLSLVLNQVYVFHIGLTYFSPINVLWVHCAWFPMHKDARKLEGTYTDVTLERMGILSEFSHNHSSSFWKILIVLFSRD